MFKYNFYLLIAGSRDFMNYDLLKSTCDRLLRNKIKTHNIIIVGGKAKGADTLGEQYGIERGFKVISKPANWKLFKGQAGHVRNVEMGKLLKKNEYKGCICFWDGISTGTKDMIDICSDYNIRCEVIYFKEKQTVNYSKDRLGM